MTTFLLVRHGETDDVGQRLTGRKAGCHLNGKGRSQAELLGRRLAQIPIQALYTSPLERAVETAEQIGSGRDLFPVVADGLNEMSFGGWEGLSFEELEQSPEWRRFNTNRGEVRPPGGELMLE